MPRIVTFCIPALAIIHLAGCVPTGIYPSYAESAAAVPAAKAVMAGMPGDQSQCQRSAAILANPMSTPAQRDGARMAADANNC
jgi:hypothetical protein